MVGAPADVRPTEWPKDGYTCDASLNGVPIRFTMAYSHIDQAFRLSLDAYKVPA